MSNQTTVSANSSVETLKQRIKQAAEVLGVESSIIVNCLNRVGIKETEMGLKILESESTQSSDAYPEFYDINKMAFPMPTFKVAWEFLKGNNPFSKETVKEVLPERLENWSDTQLLEHYNNHCNPDIEDRLKKLSNNRPFIVFSSGETIDVETSLKLLRLARRQSTPSTFDVGGELKSVYSVGEFPLEYVFESPFNPGSILTDGYCEKTGITFKTDDLEVLSFLRLIHEMEHLSSLELRGIVSVDVLTSEGKLGQLKGLFPKVTKRFNELKEENKLPSLKMKLSKRPGSADPFRQQHRAW